MPVLPAVPSTMVAPGFSRPRRSASRTVPSAARSFTEPPGFMNSALPRISQPVVSERWFRRISGVWPMQSTSVLKECSVIVVWSSAVEGGEQFRLVLGAQRVDDGVEVAFQHVIELVESQVDAVIG